MKATPTPIGAAVVLLLTVSASAADLGLPSGAPARFAWTGCYAGGQAGGGFGQKDLSDNAGFLASLGGPSSTNLSTSGYMLGGRIGCDYQFLSGWVLGVEGDATGGDIGGNTVVAVPSGNLTFKETTDFLSSGTTRIGYACGRFLPYLNGGIAWAGDRYSVFDAAAAFDAEGMETRLGWTVGVGIEWAVWDNWLVKLEYDYYGFGHHSVTFIDNVSGASTPVDIKQNIQVVNLGVNFHVCSPGKAPELRLVSAILGNNDYGIID